MVGLTGFGFLPIPCDMCSQDPSSEERFHVELHFSPGVKGCEEDRNIPTGFGFRPASAEVSGHLGRSCQPQGTLGHCPARSGPAAETCLLAVPTGSWQVVSMSRLDLSGWLLGLWVPPELGRARDPSLDGAGVGQHGQRPCACGHEWSVSLWQNEDKKADQGSLEDLSNEKGSDEPDRARQKSPQPSEPVSIQRRSPLVRNRKTGSMEVTLLLVPLLVLAKAFYLVLVSWHLFNMPESELILGKDLQKVKRDVVEGRQNSETLPH